MSTRERLTWGGAKNASATLPVEEADRRASAHPATPDEGITHPAGYDDPEQDDYKNGDTSSWAEDPTTGPYPNSAHPATPDEGPFHPAAKKAAMELRAAVERKAMKCLRIATSMLGKNASVREIEAQSLSMMDLPDSYIDQTLSRLAKKSEDEESEESEDEESEESEDEDESEESKKASRRLSADDLLLRRLLAEEDMDEGDDDEGGSDKEASDRLAGFESALAAIQKELTAMRTPEAALLAEDEVAMDDDEALLAQMLEDEMVPMGMDDDEDEALLAQMLEDEMAPVVEAEVEDAPVAEDATLADYIDDAEMDVSMDMVDDPMGLDDGDLGDMTVLSNLYASKNADDAESDEDESEEHEDSESEEEEAAEEESEKASKKASRKPRPKKASAGARTVGQPTFDKTASSEVADLARLWKSAPDVSEVF